MTYEQILERCDERAAKVSKCCKTHVGAMIYNKDNTVIFGCNTTMPDNCKEKGCHRMIVYGDDSKNHRLPSDCYAIHAEVCAISEAAKSGIRTYGAVIYVSRYPCEACARAIVTAGIKKVVYGGSIEISEQTAEIFKTNNVTVRYIPTDFDTEER